MVLEGLEGVPGTLVGLDVEVAVEASGWEEEGALDFSAERASSAFFFSSARRRSASLSEESLCVVLVRVREIMRSITHF